MMTQYKIYIETSVIIGAVQQNLITQDGYLQDLIRRGLIKQSDMYVSSKEFLDYILSNKKYDLEPLISYSVKYEIRNLISTKKQMEEKIINKIKIFTEIKKLPIDDQKIINLLLYKIFFIKLPSLTYDLIDSFTSISVDKTAVEITRDEVFERVYRPLLKRLGYLKVFFEYKGLPEDKLNKDKDYNEYKQLKKGLRTFEDFKDYHKIIDLLILGEAIVTYNKLIAEMKNPPIFYFVSCDTIFVPFNVEGNMFFKIRDNIEKSFGIKVGTPKFVFDTLTSSPR